MALLDLLVMYPSDDVVVGVWIGMVVCDRIEAVIMLGIDAVRGSMLDEDEVIDVDADYWRGFEGWTTDRHTRLFVGRQEMVCSPANK